MFENLTKTLSLVLYVLLGISVLLSVLFFAEMISESSLIIWAYILVVITLWQFSIPKRRNIVLTSQNNIESADTFANLVTLLSDLVNKGTKKIFVIGGAQIYNVFWELASALHITFVNENCVDADTIFPISIDEIGKEFKLKSTEQLTSSAQYQYWERI